MSRPGDFWARRKQAVAAEEAAATQAELAEREAHARRELEALDDEEILAELGLPDPDHLKPGDDIKGFMAQAVPDRLRRRALRQLWRLNPVLANVDGLVDYGEDFTDGAKVIENLQTAYQVGKGMLSHIEHLARQEEIARQDGEAPEDDIPPDVAQAEAPDSAKPAPEPLDAAPPHEGSAETQQNQSDTRYDAASYRPMRFRFEA